jgi:hypothetical protein
MTVYATRDDVYRQGVPRGALVSRGRFVESVDVSTNTLEVEGHGLDSGTPCQVRSDAGGGLPSPLSASVVYYALPVSGSDSLLQLSATEGGAAIDLTTTGAAPFVLFVPLAPMLDDLIEVYSRWLDSLAIGHAVPFSAPVPAWVRHCVAVRTAAHAARVLGLGTQAEQIFEAERMAISDAMRLAKGPPLRDASATAPANRAVYAVAGSALDSARESIP